MYIVDYLFVTIIPSTLDMCISRAQDIWLDISYLK